MTMAESAVEDAAAAPPGPAKPPPPACTNNNTLAATANRNHRPARKRRRLNQVLDDLQAHKIIPSEGEVPTRLDSTSLASEEEEEVFGSPRSTSRSASENALQPLTKRLKRESLRTPTEDETPSPSHMPYHHYPHYLYHHDHNNRRHHPAHSLHYQNNHNRSINKNHNNNHSNSHNDNNNSSGSSNNNNINNNNNNNTHYHSHNTTNSVQHQNCHQTNSANQNHHPSTYHRPPQKCQGCACINCANPPASAAAVAAAAAVMLLPSPTSPLTPLTPLTAFTPMSLTPVTPVSPSSYSFEHYLNTKYLPAADVTKKRSYSDSDVPGWDHRPPSSVSSVVTSHTPRSGSLESDATSPQESPLDLSMKNLGQALTGVNRPSALQLLPPDVVTRGSVSVPVVRGDVASPTTKESVASRYNLAVSPVVEAMPAGADVAYVCPVCGQMFSLHDRLAKHMASRHRRQGPRDASAKAYRCDVCKRSFARSDMLTRHMRLHTGVKPYTCKVCKQVFSRSDHLSTHQRTHTGEKPYKCPQCVYAACRRDMITRHLRTHAKMGDGQVAKCEGIGGGLESPTYGMEPMTSVVKME